jgi:hypothetical protein
LPGGPLEEVTATESRFEEVEVDTLASSTGTDSDTSRLSKNGVEEDALMDVGLSP